MTNNILSTLEIHQLTKAQYDAAKEAGKLNENALYLTPVESPITRIGGTILADASYWSGGIYTKFNTDYPHASYDIDLDISGSATEQEEEARDNAKFRSSDSDNLLVAKGTKPEIDIPVLVTIIKKAV